MPIDDALEKISTETVNLEEKKSVELIKTPDSLIQRAREIMGKVLVDHFTGKLAGQSHDANAFNINRLFLPVIEKLGFDIFYFRPIKRGQLRVLNTELYNTTDENLNKEMLKILCGEYSLKTDLATLTTKENAKNLFSLIPEFKNMRLNLFDNSSTWKDYARASIHPRLIIMGMELKYRPLATIAVEKSISKNRIEFLKEPLPNTFTREYLEKKLANVVPWTEDYVDAAKEYGITEVLPVLQEFNKVVNLYIQNWG